MNLELDEGSIAILISGLYMSSKNIHAYAIPSQAFIDVTHELMKYLPDWDYTKHTFEGWVRNDLIIAPIISFEPDELEDLKENTIYFEKVYGRIRFVITGDI